MRQRTPDLIAATAFLAGVAVLTWESQAEVYLESGQSLAHNAVFYPRILLGLTALLASMLFVAALSRRGVRVRAGATSYGRVAALAGVVSLYVIAMPLLGFLASTIAFLAIAPVMLGFRGWVTIALVAALFPLVSWWLFVSFLKIPLPGATMLWAG